MLSTTIAPAMPASPRAHAHFGIADDRRPPCRIRSVVRLRGPWDILALLLPALGPVRVLEGDAGWFGSGAARFIGDPLAAMRHQAAHEILDAVDAARRWSEGFAVIEETDGALCYSLQFFDAVGAAAHRVYLMDDSHVLAWSRLVRCFGAPRPRAQ